MTFRRLWSTMLTLSALVTLSLAPALAEEVAPYPPTDRNEAEVEAEVEEVDEPGAAEVEVLDVAAERLAITGTDAMMLAVIGLLLVILGVVAVRGRRKPAAPDR